MRYPVTPEGDSRLKADLAALRLEYDQAAAENKPELERKIGRLERNIERREKALQKASNEAPRPFSLPPLTVSELIKQARQIHNDLMTGLAQVVGAGEDNWKDIQFGPIKFSPLTQLLTCCWAVFGLRRAPSDAVERYGPAVCLLGTGVSAFVDNKELIFGKSKSSASEPDIGGGQVGERQNDFGSPKAHPPAPK